jgi:hypothetical protein
MDGPYYTKHETTKTSPFGGPQAVPRSARGVLEPKPYEKRGMIVFLCFSMITDVSKKPGNAEGFWK